MNSSSQDAIAGLMMAGMGLFWIVYILVFIVLMALFIVCQWKIYVKAGEPGWAALIPYYNIWVLMKITCNNNILWFILFIVAATSPVAAIISYIGLAKSFGKGVGTILLLIFLPIVGWPMLAFGKAEYDPALKF